MKLTYPTPRWPSSSQNGRGGSLLWVQLRPACIQTSSWTALLKQRELRLTRPQSSKSTRRATQVWKWRAVPSSQPNWTKISPVTTKRMRARTEGAPTRATPRGRKCKRLSFWRTPIWPSPKSADFLAFPARTSRGGPLMGSTANGVGGEGRPTPVWRTTFTTGWTGTTRWGTAFRWRRYRSTLWAEPLTPPSRPAGDGQSSSLTVTTSVPCTWYTEEVIVPLLLSKYL